MPNPAEIAERALDIAHRATTEMVEFALGTSADDMATAMASLIEDVEAQPASNLALSLISAGLR